MTRASEKFSRTLSKNSGAAGGSLIALASRKGGLFGVLLGLGGAFLLFKAVQNGRSQQKRLPSSTQAAGRDVHLSASVVVDRPASDVYEFWRDFSNLPRIMNFLEQVTPREGNISHWVARLPAGPSLEWDSEVIEDVPDHRLSWRSLEGSEINTWGSVIFEPRADGKGTEVSVALNFNPPGNSAGTAAAHFLKGLESSVLSRNMRNLKAHMEAGAIPIAGR
ncbi:MAG: SRPBCC family protein [Marinobacter sp.]|uniref:SRPBCC family protein n=1 Tax=Marinobacter sp. TaxID=50741 RepID=UPI003299CD77